MKFKMPYDDYAMAETKLNCENQDIPAGFGFYILAYQERVFHELELITKDRSSLLGTRENNGNNKRTI